MNWLLNHVHEHSTAVQSGDLVRLGVLIAADVLVLFSVVSLSIIIERALALGRARKLEESEFTLLRDGWRQNSPHLSQKLAQSLAPSARAVQSGIELMRDLQSSPRGSAAPHSNTRELAREAITQSLDVESARLSRNLPFLGTVASTAPYIGLFGTVLGILSAFNRIAQTGQTGASAVAGPISEALIATGLGLGVAIPAVMAYNVLSSRVSDLMLRVETHALDLSARMIGSAPHAESTNGVAPSHAPIELAKPVAASTSAASGGDGDAR